MRTGAPRMVLPTPPRARAERRVRRRRLASLTRRHAGAFEEGAHLGQPKGLQGCRARAGRGRSVCGLHGQHLRGELRKGHLHERAPHGRVGRQAQRHARDDAQPAGADLRSTRSLMSWGSYFAGHLRQLPCRLSKQCKSQR